MYVGRAGLLEPRTLHSLFATSLELREKDALASFDGNEAALLVQRVAKSERPGLQLRPVGAERIRRHEEHQNAGEFQSFLDLRRDTVAYLDRPFIKPHFQPVLPQPLRGGAHVRLVL